MSPVEEEQLRRIEDRLAHIETMLGKAEQTLAVFLAGPGRRLMKLLGGGG